MPNVKIKAAAAKHSNGTRKPAALKSAQTVLCNPKTYELFSCAYFLGEEFKEDANDLLFAIDFSVKTSKAWERMDFDKKDRLWCFIEELKMLYASVKKADKNDLRKIATEATVSYTIH